MFGIGSMVRITAVAKVSMRKIGKLPFWPKNTLRNTLPLPLEKFQNTVNVILHSVRNVSEMMI